MQAHDSPYITGLRYAQGERCMIATPRFILHALTPQETDSTLVDWLNDEEVVRHLDLPPGPYDLSRARKYVAEHARQNAYLFAINAREGGVGMIGCFALGIIARHRLAQTGLWIGNRQWWGKGVVAEVRNAVVDFSFRVAGCEKVFGHCHSTNIPAIFNYKSEGWTPDGVMRKHHRIGEERVDLVQFARFRDDWMKHIDAWRQTPEARARRGTSSGPAETA